MYDTVRGKDKEQREGEKGMRQNHGTVIALKMGRNLKPPQAPEPCSVR